MKRDSRKKWMGLILLLAALVLTGQTKQVVYAAGDTITLDTVNEREKEFNEIYTLPKQASITFTLQPTEAVELGYQKFVKGKNSNKEKIAYADTVTFTSSEIADRSEDDDESVGVHKVFVTAQAPGTAELTVTIDNSGVVTSKNYSITVKGVKPKFKLKLSDKVLRSGEITALELNGSATSVSPNAKITIKANKNKAVWIKEYDDSKKKRVLKKNQPCSFEAFDGETTQFELSPIKGGKITFTVTVEQDGYKVEKQCVLNVVKYVNPFQSFRIGTKDYAKKFDKNPTAGERMKKAEALYMMAKPYSIKMKKGYKLEKIEYRNVGEWDGTKAHKLKGSVLPKRFWELYITYKDSKGNKWQNSMFLDGSYFDYLQN